METAELQAKVTAALETQEAKDVKTLIAYAVKKTGTLKDDEILTNIDQVAGLVAKNLAEIADQNPTDKDAREAVMRILRSVAAQTSTKWDDRILAVLDMFI
jgi:hypothetical protein